MKGNFENIICTEVPVLVLWYDTFDFDMDFDNKVDSILQLLDDIKSSLGDKIRVLKIAVSKDSNKHFKEEYKIRKTPAMTLFHKGEIILNEKYIIGKNVIIDNVLDLYSTGQKYVG
jgi:hypothetical protein